MGDGRPRTPSDALEPDTEVNKLAYQLNLFLESVRDDAQPNPNRLRVSTGAAWLKLRGGMYGLSWPLAHDAGEHLDNGSTVNHVLYYAADQESLATVVFELFRSRGSKFLFEHGFDIDYRTNRDWRHALWMLCVLEGDTGHDH